MAWGESLWAALPAWMGMLAAAFGGTDARAADQSPPALPGRGIDDRAQAIGCMTSAVLYEAGFEPTAGQEAVAEVILNRLRNPAFPKTVCGVVLQGSQRSTGCQFSFTCDGSMGKVMPADAILRARAVATRAIDGQLLPRIAGATHYHADYVLPYWASSLVRLGSIGRHIFYRQPGAWGFSSLAHYDAAGEMMPAALAGELGTLPTTPAAPASTKPKQPERFMPWGLAPAGFVQTVAPAKP